ncbi:MAG TPA: PAS domain S-box protein [Nannocystis exedens]|nr:PAS domain S-box protein [Nannocystis exedens]
MADSAPSRSPDPATRIRELEAQLARSEHSRIAAEEEINDLRIDLKVAQEHHRIVATQSEQLFTGLKVISEAHKVDEIFAGMLAVLRDVLHFDEAFILVFAGEEEPKVVASTHPDLGNIRWISGSFTRRVLSGKTLALFDISSKSDWQGVPPTLRNCFSAALHVPLASPHSPAMLVCLHTERGFFTAEHSALARRYVGLASQAVQNAEHATELEAMVIARTEALRHERDFALQLTMSMAQGLVTTDTTDTQGLITLVNPAFIELSGWPATALIGRPLSELLLDTDGRPQDPRKDPDSSTQERLLRCSDGNTVLVMISTAPRRSASSDGAIHVFTDLRKRQEIQAALEFARDAAEANSQAKSMFLANMSHELRTPLNAIIGYCELLLEEADERDDQTTSLDLQRIHTSSRLLLELIGNVLDLSKIEAGKIEFFIEKISIPELCRNAITSVEPIALANNNTLLCTTKDDLPTLHADRTKLRQILINLLSNACKFTLHGEVELSVSTDPDSQGNDMLTFSVRDTGIGMTPEQVASIFEPFIQADAAPSRRYAGTGLGLTISRHFTELMGGTLEVESEPGKGTTFTVCLPPAQLSDAPLHGSSAHS